VRPDREAALLNPILAFYFGSHPDSEGRRLAEILRQDDLWLEQTHDYIQWLCPLAEPCWDTSDMSRLRRGLGLRPSRSTDSLKHLIDMKLDHKAGLALLAPSFSSCNARPIPARRTVRRGRRGGMFKIEARCCSLTLLAGLKTTKLLAG